MEKKTPGAVGTAREGEAIGTSDSTNVVALNQDRNTSTMARQEALEHLGPKSMELCGTGRRRIIDRVAS